MTLPIITIENLSKEYLIGQKESPYSTFRETIMEFATAPFKRWQRLRGKVGAEQRFLALKDINLQVNEGEVVGIIGRNGAGKSTLLKILSRITNPTTGRVVVRGRVGSLLEVGTGFHPELTGRENIYLNAAILGMKRREIDKKFDEIVGFSEIEKFLDTPVKRYSSGMQVRLAFAVAAHLEPDILIVDEVLAVGDAAFQKKCLGKMEDISVKSGRTVLFVSHNMQAVQSLCSRALLLQSGALIDDGEAGRVVNDYMSSIANSVGQVEWSRTDAPGNNELQLLALRIISDIGKTTRYSSKEALVIEMEFNLDRSDPALCIGFDLMNSDGTVVFRSYQTDLNDKFRPVPAIGRNVWRCVLPESLLNAGTYYIAPRIGIDKRYWIVHEEPALKFEITLDHGESDFWNTLAAGGRPGCIAPVLKWERIN